MFAVAPEALDHPTLAPEAVFAPLSAQPGAVWLDGGDDEPWSILAWDPVEVWTGRDAWVQAGRRLTGSDPSDARLPFTGGVIGLVGYGAGVAVAPMPAGGEPWEPHAWLGRYAGALLHHRSSGRWIVAGTETVRREARALLADAASLPPPVAAAPRPTRTLHREAWLTAAHAAKDLIARGDVYQLNLTRPVMVEDAGDAWAAWRRLRAASRPGRGAYLVLDDQLRVLSNSPERLLDMDGVEVVTEPIKGTRPRHPDPRVDAALAAELEASDKERAELTMIVDLCRNDLGRVAVPGSVRTSPRRLTAHANVHHASRRVHATLRDGLDAWDALAALFPPGSVTGAPKVRACQRIAELEPHARGAYCGAIGYASGHGRAGWSVAIRTAIFRGTEARWHVGSGLVADSDPEAEWEETVAKGTVLARAIAGVERA